MFKNAGTKSLVTQAAVLMLVILAIALVGRSLFQNLSARGIPLGFDFLFVPAGFNMSETVLPYSPSTDPYWWAAVVGLVNTLYLSLIVIALSTVLGTLVAIGRLGSNILANGICRVWVEVARNTPPIILLFLIYSMWWKLLPQIDAAWEIGPNVFVSLRGLVFPRVSVDLPNFFYALFLVALAATYVARRLAVAKLEASGHRPPYVPIAFLLSAVALVLYINVSNINMVIDIPKRDNGFFTGGAELSPEFSSIVIGLTIYTTGFVAEIVRGGILAIPKGQWEASRAVGLSEWKILRLVVLPQTLRIILPPMNSQYINVLKNSTLAIAIGYMDFLTVMQTIINTSSHAIEGTLIILGVYLVVNLSLSTLMNRWNNRLLKRGRQA